MGGNDEITIPVTLDGKGFEKGSAQIKNAVSSMDKETKKAGQDMKKSCSGMGGVLKKAFGGIGKALKGIALGPIDLFKKAFSGIKKIGSKLFQPFKKGGDSLTGGIKKMLPMLLGVGSAFAVISKSVNAFMSQNEQLSAKMSSIWTAFGNLLGPIIEKLIGWVTTAVSYLLSFLKLLGVTGKTASQLSKSAKGAGSELQKTLAGFDELNTLQKGGGGGASGSLDDVEPPDWMKKVAELIKGKKFEQAGREIAKKLNEFIKNIDLSGFAKKISETFIGILDFLTGFIDELDFREIGKKIREFFLNIDWKGIINSVIKLLASILRGGVELLWGVLYEDDGSGEEPPLIKSLFGLVDSLQHFCDVVLEAGDKIMQALGPALEWVGDSILPGIIDSFSTLIDDLSLFIQLITGDISVSEFFDQVKNPLEGVTESAKNAYQGIADFIENIDWQELGANIAEFILGLPGMIWGWLTEIDWEGLASSFFEYIGAFFGGIAGFFTGLWNEAVTEIGEWLTETWNGLGNLTWDGFCQGILDAIVSIGTWIKTNILDPFVKGFKTAFDIKSPSKVMEEIGEFVIDGFFNGIKTIWNNVSTWITEKKEELVNKFIEVRDSITQKFGEAWETIKTGASDAWEGIKDVFSTVGTWFKDTFSNAWQGIVDIFSVAGEIFVDIKEGVKDAFVSIVNQLITGINKVVAIPFNGINSVLTAIKEISILGAKPFDFISTISVPQIPYLAQGGVLKKGQLGLLEGSGAEAVVPLEKNTEWINRVAEGMMDRLASGEYSLGTIGKNLAILNDIAERIYFKMPAVAGGSVLPYSVSGSQGGDDTENNESAILEALGELNEAIGDLRHSLENMQWIAQFGNVRAIVQEITTIQRQMQRATGGF